MKKVSETKLFEFRIKYNAGAEHVELDNYHYYNAPDAKTALSFHYKMMKKKGIVVQTLSIEKYNPYSLEWEDESEHINSSFDHEV